jgi:hypothetical protein
VTTREPAGWKASRHDVRGVCGPPGRLAAGLVATALGRWGRLDICVANAASKGGLLTFGRSLAAEGAGQGVLTNLLLPYALTQMTDDGMPSARKHMAPDAVAPVLTRWPARSAG